MGTIRIPTAGVTLDADVTLPADPIGVVAFAHGSGSSRHSPRNRAVAAGLGERRLGTVLADLLTAEEDRVDTRFDIDLLTDRMVGIVDWLGQHTGVPVGLFGASTGAAAALVAAAERPAEVRAVVSRGGRPDLAGPALARVRAPTLLIVGQNDTRVLDLNEQARAKMTATTDLRVIPGATHLFEEPGALDLVTAEAGRWFVDYLVTGGGSGEPAGPR
ncbi:dienelactone hydrolase family protein [Asanoa iriomotensis]|uniref:Hydrolase n=1 Tax=Asanoa iriomotensis TaxID=234613 RepID=A0ABQ4CD45_9ACTN|nr:dienelactone hydrolase family protein [Asanoa iriomotensis]GIF60691.1 hydrolase [Asanoa iriomotensis]